MHFANQGRALQDKRYEFALKQLPAAHQTLEALQQQQQNSSGHNNNSYSHQQQQQKPINPLKQQNRQQIESTANIAAVVRASKQHGANYFGAGIQQDLSRRKSTLLQTNMSYQAHQIQREKQMDAYVRGLEAEDVQVNQIKEQQRLAALEEARLVDRIKLQQSARNRIHLQQKSHQKIPKELLSKHGLDDEEVGDEMAKQQTQTAEQRRQLRELPRQAHIEYNLPRLMDTALNRIERIDAHHEKINRRVDLEERVGTGYANKRIKEHGKVRRAKRAAKKALSITAALGTDDDNDDDDIVDEDGTGALLLKATRLPEKDELRVAREMAKNNRLLLRDEAQEKRQLWNEMNRLDKQTSEDAKKARKERKKVKKGIVVDSSDSDY